MADIPTAEPTIVNAGDTVRWQRTLSQYPASAGWVLTYTLLNAAAKITITATASNDAHLVGVDAATTATWSAGQYAWRSQVARTGEVFTVGEGSIRVAPSFGAATLETRSPACQAYDSVMAYLYDPSNLQAAKYSIAGRSLDRYPIEELWKHRDRLYMQMTPAEQAARAVSRSPLAGRIYTRFGA
jgi:hypothetical protein